MASASDSTRAPSSHDLSRRSAAALLAGFLAVPAVAPAATAARHPDTELLRLGALFQAAWAEERRADDAVSASDDPALGRAFDDAYKHARSIAEQIEGQTATTLEGVLVKAAVASWCYSGDLFGPDLLGSKPTTDKRIAIGIVRDLIAMG